MFRKRKHFRHRIHTIHWPIIDTVCSFATQYIEISQYQKESLLLQATGLDSHPQPGPVAAYFLGVTCSSIIDVLCPAEGP